MDMNHIYNNYFNYVIKTLRYIIWSKNLAGLNKYLEDMCHDVFLSVYENLHNYDDNFSMTTFINLHIHSVVSKYRKNYKQLVSNVDISDAKNIVADATTFSLLELKEKLIVSGQCIANYRHRLMYDLVNILGNEQQDVANFMRITVESLRVYLSLCNKTIQSNKNNKLTLKNKMQFPPDEVIWALLYSDLWTASILLTRYIYGLQLWEIREKTGLDELSYWQKLNQTDICEWIVKEIKQYKENLIQRFSNKSIAMIAVDLGIEPLDALNIRQILGIKGKGRKAIEYDVSRSIPEPGRRLKCMAYMI